VRLAVFVSGRGSNLKAILDDPELKDLVEVAAVISDKKNCPAFEIAERHSIPVFNTGKEENFIPFDSLADFLVKLKIDLIVLAGFLKMIPGDVVKNFNGKIINIHPALLPSFGGKGMYGMNVHKAVFESSAKVSGATVHFADEEYDRGKIIAQTAVDISDAESPQQIAELVLDAEHNLLPFVIKKIAQGKVKIVNSRAIVEK
jgi:phosphoribosylglycinamide formyltransferase 1